MLAFGLVLAVLPFAYGVGGTPRVVDLVAGLGVIGTAALYLASPTWRSHVLLDDRGLAVVGPHGERMRLDFTEIVEIIADEEERAALVRGPDGARSLLVPSPAHPAPYRIERAPELFARLCQALPEKVRRSKVFR